MKRYEYKIRIGGRDTFIQVDASSREEADNRLREILPHAQIIGTPKITLL